MASGIKIRTYKMSVQICSSAASHVLMSSLVSLSLCMLVFLPSTFPVWLKGEGGEREGERT